MTYDNFLLAVKERAQFRSHEQARKAVDTVLAVLGSRISTGQAGDIAAALPQDLRPFLQQTAESGSFSREQFLIAVGEKEGVSVETAEEHARAVLSVVADWIPRPELRDTLEQLPHDLRNFFAWTKKAA